MSLRDKILVCLVPFLLAAILWFGLASQAYVDWQEKDKQIEEKNQEQTQLKTKLANLARVDKERAALNLDIEALRSAVPKSPDLDILLIDLEKMCLDSSMDLVSVDKPDAKSLSDTQAQDAEAKELASASGKLSVGAKSKDVALGAKADKSKTPGGKNEVKSAEEEAGLNKQVLSVTVIGDYPSLIELMKKLQGYERVTGIGKITIGLPDAKDKGKGDPSKQLKISFLLTAYYLP
jgi:hypothetical protein